MKVSHHNNWNLRRRSQNQQLIKMGSMNQFQNNLSAMMKIVNATVALEVMILKLNQSVAPRQWSAKMVAMTNAKADNTKGPQAQSLHWLIIPDTAL